MPPVVPRTCLYNPRKRLPVRAALVLGAPTAGCLVITIWLMVMVVHTVPQALLATSVLLGLAYYSARWSLKLQSRVGSTIRPKLEERFGRSFEDFTHVGVSPNKDAKTYAGDTSWDIGFVSVDDRLAYFGDQCWFSLARDQILRYKLVAPAGNPPRLQIEYVWPGWEGARWINFEARDALSRTGQFLALQRLANRIAIMPGRPPMIEEPSHRNLSLCPDWLGKRG